MQPAIILVNPQMGANIGAAARVMLNFGLRDLRIVNPRDGWPNAEAVRNASGALDDEDSGGVKCRVFETFTEAISDLHYVLATTARPRDLVKPISTPQQAASEFKTRSEAGQGCGFVFGAERTGLVNDDIALCNGIINIPTNPDFSSLNLGQAVLLCAWEWMRAQDVAHVPDLGIEGSPPVMQDELHNFFGRLEGALEQADFFKAPDLKPTMIRNIRSMFTRSDLTEQEVRTLHGILSALSSGQKKAP